MNRDDFTILKNNNIVYFDNGATTLKPDYVVNSVVDFYNKYTSNIHRGDYHNSLQVSKLYEDSRSIVKNYINADSENEVVFTSGTTESLNMIINGYFRYKLKKGDEVLITVSEHASVVLPWFILSEELGIKIKFIPLNSKNEVTINALEESISDRTKVVCIAHVTNVLGDVRNISDISKVCHKYNILLVVDAAQSAGHQEIDVSKMGIDFLAFSGHKMYGPSGVGVLYGKYELLNDLKPTKLGGGMNISFNSDGEYVLKDLPSRLEAGTPNIEGVIGLGSAIKYINNIGLSNIINYEKKLRDYLICKMKELDFIKIYNIDNDSNTVIFNIKGVFAQDSAIYLDKYNICVRAGNHCAKMLKDVLGIGNTCRISLSFYNTKEEIDLFINVLKNSKNIWEEIL